MLKIFSCLFSAICITGFAQYAQLNIDLLGRFNDTLIPAETYVKARYSGIWGYAANNKEYAILGASNGNYFIDVTNPTQPKLCGFVAGRNDSCLWREQKTYSHYAYLVSDGPPNGSLQIVDLNYLPDSVHVVYDSDSLFFRAHTIYIDHDKMYCGSVSSNPIRYQQMSVYHLADPEKPRLLTGLKSEPFGGVHDMFVRNDTVYASCGGGGLHIYTLNMSDTTLTEISSLTSYPYQGYNHSSSLTADGKTLIFMDEVPENLPIKSLNTSDILNPMVVDTFRSSLTATPHNPYVVGNDLLVCSYYQDGIQLFDIANPSKVNRIGFFDTNPTDGSGLPDPSYSGCWGAYPYLPSGHVLASDMQEGLFVLDISAARNLLGIKSTEKNKGDLHVFPNPASSNLTIKSSNKFSEPITLEIKNILGISVKKEILTENIPVDISTLSDGIYIVTLSNKNNLLSKQQVVKIH